MSGCPRCGAPDQSGRFCTDCGSPVVAPPTEQVSVDKGRAVGPDDPTVLGAALPDPAAGGAASTAPPTGAYPVPSPTTPDARAIGRRRGRGAVALVVLAVAVVLLAGVGVWFGMRPVGGEGATTATPPTTAALPAGEGPARAEASAGADPSTRPAPVGPGGRKGDPGSPSAPATIVTTVATTTVGLNPMGGDRSDIACGSGYIVQVASELDQPSFEARVAALRAAGTLPASARWTETAAGCSLFTNQANVYVLFAGPFPTWQAACPDRLAAPPDAFIKPTDPSSAGSFLTCLCPADVAGLPAITTIGQQGVWVGELQRVLGAGLDYDVGSINAENGNPGHWGEYSDQTAAAVGRFQADQGLPVTGQVDAATWGRLQAARCR